MASTILLSNANNLFPSLPSTSSSPAHSTRRSPIVCKAAADDGSSTAPPWTRRGVSITVVAATTLLFGGYRSLPEANAAVAGADEGKSLLDRVKEDTKQKLARLGTIKSSEDETALLQDLVYKLGKISKAIDKEDLPAAYSLLGPGIDTNWVQKVNFALNQLSSTGDEKVEIDNININLAALIASVDKNDIPTARYSLDAVGNAFKKWATLTGLDQKLKGI